jgi:heme-degrading monooxygenase HmoA
VIARIWHGRTHVSKIQEYSSFLETVAIPDYRSTAGNLGLTFLRKVEGNEAHFKLITFWDSLESIKNFAGEDISKAKYYPEDNGYLLEFEEKVEHFEVFAKH